MEKIYASLSHIVNDRKLTKEHDQIFLHHLQSGLLLALKEQGKLDELQYRHAQDRLDQQFQDLGNGHPIQGKTP